MKTKEALRNGFPVVCKIHVNDVMKEKENGFIFCRKCHINKVKRQRNEIFRELCGTSARAAREDMGL